MREGVEQMLALIKRGFDWCVMMCDEQWDVGGVGGASAWTSDWIWFLGMGVYELRRGLSLKDEISKW